MNGTSLTIISNKFSLQRCRNICRTEHELIRMALLALHLTTLYLLYTLLSVEWWLSGDLKRYCDQIFTPWFLSVSCRIPWKNKNAIYHLQISALVPEKFKSEKWANKTFNKRKNRALLTLRRSQKHHEIFSNNVLRKNITRKQLRLETIDIAWFRVGSVPAL